MLNRCNNFFLILLFVGINFPGTIFAENKCLQLFPEYLKTAILDLKTSNQTFVSKDRKAQLDAVAKSAQISYELLSHLDVGELVETVFKHANSDLKNKIKTSVTAVDHIGYIVPGRIDNQDLISSIKKNTSFGLQRSFPSTIVAKELATILKLNQPVPTEIFIFKSGNKSLEIFKPILDSDAAAKIIQRGIGTHIALLIQSKAELLAVMHDLLSQGYAMPDFMNNQAMENPKQNSLTAYFDLQFQGQSLRIEFIAMEPVL